MLSGILLMGSIGFIDDYIKLRNKNSRGVRALAKLTGQIALALIVGFFVVNSKALGADLYLPFVKNAVCNLGTFYIIFALLVIVGSSNAVNLTDGLDGLAVGCVTFITLTYAVVSYVTGHAGLSKYLQVFYLPGGSLIPIRLELYSGRQETGRARPKSIIPEPCFLLFCFLVSSIFNPPNDFG